MMKKNLFYSSAGHSGEIPFFSFPGFLKFNQIIHFVTTRHEGVSSFPFSDLNLAFHVGDKEEDVFQNRFRLAHSFNLPMHCLTVSNQVHGTNVHIVKSSEKGCGSRSLTDAIPSNDAMVTNQPGICLLVLVADCVPILLYDLKKKVIGVIHAGWKGTLGRITQKTVDLMKSQWNCLSNDIFCAIGPSIGPCCYEVGEEVIEKIGTSFTGMEKQLCTFLNNREKTYLNLWEANRLQLLNCQIPADHIEIASLCTSCHSDTFFSSRKGKGLTGRFATGIMLRD